MPWWVVPLILSGISTYRKDKSMKDAKRLQDQYMAQQRARNAASVARMEGLNEENLDMLAKNKVETDTGESRLGLDSDYTAAVNMPVQDRITSSSAPQVVSDTYSNIMGNNKGYLTNQAKNLANYESLAGAFNQYLPTLADNQALIGREASRLKTGTDVLDIELGQAQPQYDMPADFMQNLAQLLVTRNITS